MRKHYLYCPRCSYFNDTCDCELFYNHAGIEHDDCEKPTNAWPKAATALIDAEICLQKLPDVEGAFRVTVLSEVREAIEDLTNG